MKPEIDILNKEFEQWCGLLEQLGSGGVGTVITKYEVERLLQKAKELKLDLYRAQKYIITKMYSEGWQLSSDIPSNKCATSIKQQLNYIESCTEEWYPTFQLHIQAGSNTPVICIPPLLTYKARKELQQALKATGYDVTRMLSFPIAATLAFGRLTTTPNSCIAITLGIRENNIDIVLAEFFEANFSHGLVEILSTHSFNINADNPQLRSIKILKGIEVALAHTDLSKERKINFVGLYNTGGIYANDIEEYFHITPYIWNEATTPVIYGLNIMTEILSGCGSKALVLLDFMELSVSVYITNRGEEKLLGTIRPQAIPLRKCFYYGDLEYKLGSTIKVVQLNYHNKVILLEELPIPMDLILNEISISVNSESEVSYDFSASNGDDELKFFYN